MDQKKKIDVYQMVTDRIIAALEKKIIPWRQPWKSSGPPQNLVTGKVYRGINFWLLLSLNYARNYFLSFKQIKDLGGKVKEGEKSNIIVFWKQIEMEDEETNEKKNLPFLRYYTVFNIDQCEGLPEEKLGVLGESNNIPITSCEIIVTQMQQRPPVHHKEGRAFYNPLKDFISMPPKNNFESSEAYYGTLFHELIHSTGHMKRLNRKELLQMAEFGSEPYSVEELTAEIGASYLNTIVGIDNSTFENSTAYIQGWLSRLKNDNRCIVYASTQAQKATDYILNIKIESVVDSATDGIEVHDQEEKVPF